MSEAATRDRFRGCLLGLAAGDALGTTLEFKSPGSFEPIDDMVGGGPHRLQPGQWTDDTSMALCLATSLVECGGFDATDQMQRYVRWWREGYLSSTKSYFDIGNTVSAALSRFIEHGDPFAGSTDPYSAGNGSLMRLGAGADVLRGRRRRGHRHGRGQFQDHAPGPGSGRRLPLLRRAVAWAPCGASTRRRCCPGAIARWKGYGKAIPWRRRSHASPRDRSRIATLPTSGAPDYVVDALEAALWAFHRSDGFREGALLAVNLGDDADTTGAIYGQIAGAHYGAEAIPATWRDKLTMAAEITSLADRLHGQAALHPK